MPFSRRHYRDVSPPDDTPAQIAARLADNRVREQLLQETRAKIEAAGDRLLEQAEEILAWQEARLRELRIAAGLAPA